MPSMESKDIVSLVDVYLAALPHGPRQRLLEEHGVCSVAELTDGVRNDLYKVLFLNTKA